ncbi:hypothetical protein [Chelatococcus sp.]|uniref:hypothetical protein n=1 Tax=Chelatococcus sp. TaxID=1953771 RepID=UPI001ECB3D0F|nr:hypothetical protein [Chelatococcus sp.]MBX3543742.1 hypothetical protein [Chelatococcus sp.]CAH1677756.1 conserved hypothetical protein [Hyphomicrobiales bacterium]
MDQLDRALAQVALLRQLVRLLLLERAYEGGKTPDDILAYAEKIRQFFEENNPPGIVEMRMNAEVTAFFDQLADELRGLRGSP